MTPKEFGWIGSVLRINLTNRTCRQSSSMEYSSQFIGGRSVARRLYWADVSENTDAFSPDNCLYFMNGPLSGTRTPASSRWTVLGKSPMASPEQ